MSNTLLAELHPHPRDQYIQFFERGHEYKILTDPYSKYTSVTTWNHGHFPPFNADDIIDNMMRGKYWNPGHKYWGLDKQQIKNLWSQNSNAVSSAGTNLHADIEHFMNLGPRRYFFQSDLLIPFHPPSNPIQSEGSKEWSYFLKFVQDHPRLVPFRTEWMIYDEDVQMAGSIDMVYVNPADGSLSIYDWKRSKEITKTNSFGRFASNPLIAHLPDTNYWHYALQLNTYKTILERKYGVRVKDLHLVRLHPDNNPDDTYELIPLPILEKEMADLFAQRERIVSAKKKNA